MIKKLVSAVSLCFLSFYVSAADIQRTGIVGNSVAVQLNEVCLSLLESGELKSDELVRKNGGIEAVINATNVHLLKNAEVLENVNRIKIDDTGNGFCYDSANPAIRLIDLFEIFQIARMHFASPLLDFYILLPETCERHDKYRDFFAFIASVEDKDTAKVGKMLSRLEINAPAFKDLPESMARLSNIEWLSLEDCKSMEKIPNWIGNFAKLERLSIKCEKLESMPDIAWFFPSLKRLSFMDCHRLRVLPRWIVNSVNLEWLTLANCGSLTSLSTEYENFGKLEQLNLSGLFRIRTFPHWITKLRSLKKLILHRGMRISESDILELQGRGVKILPVSLLQREYSREGVAQKRSYSGSVESRSTSARGGSLFRFRSEFFGI